MDRKYKILIVDDDPSALLLMETILKPQGYDLVFQNNGMQVIEVARKEKPDLILLDVMMPIFDGYGVVIEIREDKVLREIPVVMVTALGQDSNKEIARTCGANAYITKPINYKELIKTVAYLLSGSAPNSIKFGT